MAFSSEAQPRTRVLEAFVEGWKRTVAAPVLVVGVAAATFLCALPLAIVLHGEINADLAARLPTEAAAHGWDAGWASAFSTSHPGLGATFTFEILGFGGTITNLSNWIDHEPLNPALAGAIGAYLTVWIFLSGGLVDRLARRRPLPTAAFFSACQKYFARFLRLAAMAGLAYWALFRWLHPFLFGRVYDRWTRDITGENPAIARRAVLYAVFLIAVTLVNVVVDFAKVRGVLEDRRSMLGALAASLRFLRRRPLRAAGLYLLNGLTMIAIVRLWYSLAPGVSAPDWTAFLVAQVYLTARLWAKVAFLSSEIAFFQGELGQSS
jgi:hypothetical protein